MSRDTHANIDAVLDDDNLRPVVFALLVFDDGTLRLHNDLGTIEWDSEDWIGTGDFGSVDAIEERDDHSPTGTVLRLSGIDATLLNEALTEDYYDRDVTLYLGMRDLVTGELESDPFELFAGRMDQMRVLSGIPSSIIELAVESEMREYDRSPLRWFSDSQLQKDYSGDLGFQFMSAMANIKISVGSKATTLLGNPGGSTEQPGYAPRFI